MNLIQLNPNLDTTNTVEYQTDILGRMSSKNAKSSYHNIHEGRKNDNNIIHIHIGNCNHMVYELISIFRNY